MNEFEDNLVLFYVVKVVGIFYIEIIVIYRDGFMRSIVLY